MEIKDLTLEMVTPVLEALVAEFGEDHIYKADERGENGRATCSYQEGGKPSCIVGHVLDRLGVEYNPEWEGINAGGVLSGAPFYVARGLQKAQKLQDDGKTWGEALSSYRRYLKSRYV